MTAAAVAGFAVYEVARRRVANPVRWGAGAAAAMWQPRLVLPVTAAAGLLAWRRRLARRRADARAAAADLPLLAELVTVGLSAGLSFRAALEAAAGETHPRLATEVMDMLGVARVEGLATALSGAAGLAEPLYRAAARAVVTGAPLLGAMSALSAEFRHIERTDQEAAAQRLPVRLLLPLALLILPGFVLLTLGPALLSAVDRLRI